MILQFPAKIQNLLGRTCSEKLSRKEKSSLIYLGKTTKIKTYIYGNDDIQDQTFFLKCDASPNMGQTHSFNSLQTPTYLSTFIAKRCITLTYTANVLTGKNRDFTFCAKNKTLKATKFVLYD